MMQIYKVLKNIVFLFTLPLILSAQKNQNDEDLGTQEITVIKTFMPNLKNVFKIVQTPELDDSLINKKQKVIYTFKPFAAVSTFIPNKATPLKFKRQELIGFHNSFVSSGIGNKFQKSINFTSMVTMDRFQSVGLALRFNSLGEIPGTILESTEKRLTINLLHQYKERNMRIDSDIRYDSQSHNLYGLRDINWKNIPSFRSSLVNPLQRLNYLSVKSKWQWYESVLSKMNFNTYITSDSFDSTEYIFSINALFRIPFLGNYLDLTPNFEMINSNFKSDYFTDLPIDFKNALTQLQIKFLNFGKKFNFVLGVNGFYLIDEQNQFFVYPKLEVSYKSINSKIVPFIDYEGGYKLNSYTSFSLENPYVAPVLNIQPTEVNHNLNIGFNLFPSSGLTLKMSASYIEYNNFGMFVRLPYDNFNNDIAFRLGNSYRVIYDQVEKKGLSSGFILQLKEFNKVSLDINYYDYTRKNNEPVWNTPSLTIDLEGNFKLGRKIFFNFSTNYFSSREIKNYLTSSGELSYGGPSLRESIGSVIYANSSLTWKINSEWDLFYRNNIYFGDVTSRWAYYQNQPQLNLIGIRYKFDINF